MISGGAYPLILIATFFRFIGSIVIMINMPLFFGGVFPDYLDEFTIFRATLPFFTIVNVVASGVLADYFETDRGGKRYRMRGFISAIGTIIAIPTLYVAFVLQPSFWACLGSLILDMTFSNQYITLSLSMKNNILPSHLQGTGVAILFFSLNISFITSQFVLGALTKGISTDNSKFGEMLGWISIASCVASIPFFIFGGLQYEKKMRCIKKQVPNDNK